VPTLSQQTHEFFANQAERQTGKILLNNGDMMNDVEVVGGGNDYLAVKWAGSRNALVPIQSIAQFETDKPVAT
jgi:hypothetical protein